MTKITFTLTDGSIKTIDAVDGQSVMENALANGVEGIIGECGGACACATCHVYVEQSFLEVIGEADEMEQAMLDFNEHVKPNSRLSCQIIMSSALDGLRLTIAEQDG